MTTHDETVPSVKRTALEKLLGVFTQVRAGEGTSAVLLTLNVFLLLTAYYVIKPLRDSMMAVMEGGPQYKSYLSAVMVVALLGAVPAYARFAKRLPRNRLVVGVTLFFVSNLVLFSLAMASETLRTASIPLGPLAAILPTATVELLPVVFFLWVGIFNMMVVAQFWAFGNDVYTEEQGKRLFPMLGIGASMGAVLGTGVGQGDGKAARDVRAVRLERGPPDRVCGLDADRARTRDTRSPDHARRGPPREEQEP